MQSPEVPAGTTEKNSFFSTDEAPATPVIPSVFRSVFVDAPKNFFAGIGNFFKRYFRHYGSVFAFINRPSLSVPPFNKKDFKEHAQLSFEIALLLVAALLFLIKQNLIPVDKGLQETYGNDIAQMVMEVFIFLLIATAFFTQMALSVLTGRLLRKIFSIQVTRYQSDVLFCLLSSSFFSLSALLAFVLRLGMQYEQVKASNAEAGVYLLCFLVSFTFLLWWAIRFARLNVPSLVRKGTFFLVSLFLFTLLFGVGMSALCSLILGT